MTTENRKWLDAPADLNGELEGVSGLPLRHAARVLLINELGHVLVVKGHDEDNPSRSWWFTIGGGIEPGESPRSAAVRELLEETGIALDENALEGPVMERTSLFDFYVQPIVQHEMYYFARVNGNHSLDRSGWTENEVGFMDDLAWLSPTDLNESGLEVFPQGLATIVENLAKNGWDGTVITVGLE